MSLWQHLFGSRPDRRDRVRRLWQAVVAAGRHPAWYRAGVADSVAGRFDMISTMLAVVLNRLGSDPSHGDNCAALAELFVDEMDAQLRQEGVGDIVVGKHVGRLVSLLGGRAGALRVAGGQSDLLDYLDRNVAMNEDADRERLATMLGARIAEITAQGDGQLLAGELGE